MLFKLVFNKIYKLKFWIQKIYKQEDNEDNEMINEKNIK